MCVLHVLCSFSVAVCFCMCVFFFLHVQIQVPKYVLLSFLCADMSSKCVYVPARVFHSNSNVYVHYVALSTPQFQHACMCVGECVCVCVCLLSVLRSSFDVCSPRTCSLYTALCSGWSRSGCVVLTVVPSAAVQPGPSPPCQPSSTPRSSQWSGGCLLRWSRARPPSLAWVERERRRQRQGPKYGRLANWKHRCLEFYKGLKLRAELSLYTLMRPD